jgi:hypothetical protein
MFSLIFLSLRRRTRYIPRQPTACFPHREDIQPFVTEMVFENRMLRKILGPKRDEVTE